jgi:hypothetical protein
MAESPFFVAWSPEAQLSVKHLGQKAKAAGLLGRLKQELADFQERLSQDPFEVGELYRTRGAVVEHVAGRLLILIDFAIDQDKKIVAVRKCWATDPSGLAD